MPRIGIELEQMIGDAVTGELSPRFSDILQKKVFGDFVKPEINKASVETITSPHMYLSQARTQLVDYQHRLLNLLQKEGLTLINAGTHPTACWEDQEITPSARYTEFLDYYQDPVRKTLIFSIHFHIDTEQPVLMTQQLAQWIPELTALSSNSPMWHGRYTGLKAYRPLVWKEIVPRTGFPPTDMVINQDFELYVKELAHAGYITDEKNIWWYIRPRFGLQKKTVEIRILDTTTSLDELFAIAALCQALVAVLTKMHAQGKTYPILQQRYLDESFWQAIRYGLDGHKYDPLTRTNIPFRVSLGKLLTMMSQEVKNLQIESEFATLQRMIYDPAGTGADKQLFVYNQNKNMQDVITYLMKESVKEIS